MKIIIQKDLSMCYEKIDCTTKVLRQETNLVAVEKPSKGKTTKAKNQNSDKDMGQQSW